MNERGGVAILLFSSDDQLWKYESRQYDNKILCDLNTQIQAGELSSHFVIMSALVLIKRGLLDPNDTVLSYLDDRQLSILNSDKVKKILDLKIIDIISESTGWVDKPSTNNSRINILEKLSNANSQYHANVIRTESKYVNIDYASF